MHAASRRRGQPLYPAGGRVRPAQLTEAPASRWGSAPVPRPTRRPKPP